MGGHRNARMLWKRGKTLLTDPKLFQLKAEKSC